jgi:hypothetical protein
VADESQLLVLAQLHTPCAVAIVPDAVSNHDICSAVVQTHLINVNILMEAIVRVVNMAEMCHTVALLLKMVFRCL